MSRYLLTLRFDGTAFHGWQVQRGQRTVQQTVQDALERALGHRPDLTGCSRTDAGVHARMFCAHFDCERDKPEDTMVKALNYWLPPDIAARDCRVVPDDFHARYGALGKQYVYQIWNGAARDPFLERYALHVRRPLDETRLNELADRFIGKRDFAGFCAAPGLAANRGGTTRTVLRCDVAREGDLLRVAVRADGFLYNMVRIIVGTLLLAHDEGWTPDELSAAIAKADRAAAGPTAPAHGLFLDEVYYAEDVGSRK